MERSNSKISFMESTKSHQLKRGGSLTPSSPPPQTLWSSDIGNSSFKNDHTDHKGINVQVILRCRPLNEEEKGVKTPIAISCDEHKREVTAIQNMGNKQIDKTFVFDKVFGATSKQTEVYDQVVAPIVNDALQGYNCTIFAYGQTGTGKTYTMEGGGGKEENGEFDEDAGVIPRAVQQIFDTLEAQNAEYSMKVTFIELYNEEITDLLAHDEPSQFLDDRLKKSITLMEDGKGAVFMKGLEEQIVSTADEIYKILEKGCSRKHTAETLVNKQSNRSHSLLTITIQVKECSSDGVELIKTGKLNLVDLAGSENILRSGAREGRAREAGEINKSLLTLGRVITALVEHSGHVPYRDSKLTRLLRDSLGGKTKTCIIATVSPSIHSLEETLNTLDYAFRAKNIKNRPEVNQKVIKSAVIRDLYVEVNHLKQELHATREKNGIYIPHDRYQSEQASKKVMIEKLTQMELDAEAKDKQLMNLEELFIDQQKLTAELSEMLDKTEKELVLSRQAFSDLEDKLLQANETIKEKEYLIFNLLGSENALTERAFELHTELENATSEVSSLFDKIENKNYITVRNRVLIQSFQSQLAKHLKILHKMVTASVIQQEQRLNAIKQHTQSFVSEKEKTAEELRTRLTKLQEVFSSGMRTMVDLAGELDGTSQATFGNLKSEVLKQSSGLEEIISEISSRTDDILDDLQSKLKNQEQRIAAFAQQQQESHSRTYQTTQTVSRVTVNFFKTLITCVSKLTLMVEEERETDELKLSVLQKKFEDNADNEEKELIDKVTELLANSKSRKKQLVQIELDKLRDSIASRTTKLYQEMSGMQELTFTTQEEWTSYLEKTEKHYNEDTKTVKSGKDGLTSILENSMKKARVDAEQWRQFQEFASQSQRRNIDSADSIIKDAVEANKTIHSRLLSIASTTLEESVSTQRSSLSSMDYLRKLDQDASEKVYSLMGLCHDDTKQMENAHAEKIVEITENAEKCLVNEYMIEDPLLSTPRKLLFNFPSAASIDELRTPPFEELMESFRRTGSRNQDKEDFDSSSGFHQAGQSLDSALSLAATNGGRTQDLQVK